LSLSASLLDCTTLDSLLLSFLLTALIPTGSTPHLSLHSAEGNCALACRSRTERREAINFSFVSCGRLLSVQIMELHVRSWCATSRFRWRWGEVAPGARPGALGNAPLAMERIAHSKPSCLWPSSTETGARMSMSESSSG
jgi:hypothetical protein